MSKAVVVLLFFGCATLATVVEPAFQKIESRGEASTSALASLLGDSRRLFANEFFAMADAYYHSGFYPTIFDNVGKNEHNDLKGKDDETPDAEDVFMGKPHDWIDWFGRHFYPTVHTHLHNGHEREVLPWLKMSADLDPHQVEPYVVAAYWLRRSLNQSDEAEQFLRQGLRANPNSYEILLELGRIAFYDHKDARTAHNIWELATNKWYYQKSLGFDPDPHAYEETLGEMVRADKQLGNKEQLLADLRALLKVARGKQGVESDIKQVQAELNAH